MALTTNSFLPLSSLANSNAPRMFSYGTADNAATVEGADYFDNYEIASQLNVGDVILAKMGDATKFYNVTTADVSPPNVVISGGLAIP